MNVKRWYLVRSAASMFLAASVVVGCGGGGGGGGGAISSLQGTWRGAYDDTISDQTLEVVVNASGQITSIRAGGVSLGLTGTITQVRGNIYSFILSDNTEGGFMTDASATHAGFVDEDGSFGVLEKGAAGQAASYVDADIQRNWAGYSVQLNADMTLAASGSSSATYVTGNEFAVMDLDGPSQANIGNAQPLGRYPGTWTATGIAPFGSVDAWLSADKTFAASWACTTNFLGTSGNFPNCTFAIWTRQ